ncbi:MULTISPECIES: hypothetical protein [unclassified Sphingobium]|uniref:hypothetical protein n=1 Tax=unclassified Sphingobium TaxID=2611147 RepID=UPI00222503CC|nr:MULTISPECIES: hypothetical protein [unclassified Sphingobium]MCW2412953.1 hypothetical protein [Sphingobium sp. B8D3D]MCW2414749.1 hypothetical protein [Sphingobium sp. B8D3A]
MTEKKGFAQDGWTVGEKGYTVAPGKVQNGHTGPTGTLGKPPTTGSAVSKPAPDKKS